MQPQAKTTICFRLAATSAITARQLRLARILLGMSQKGFAAASGVSEQTIQRLEKLPNEKEIEGYSSTIKRIERAFQEYNIVFFEGGAAIREKKAK